VSEPPGPETTRETLYVPVDPYRCVGFWAVDVPPSPNVHDHDVMLPDEASENATFNGATPLVGAPEKSAVGAGSETVM